MRMVIPKFYCLYSGGKDSTVAASVLAEVGMLAAVVTIRTGIAAPDWYPFIRKTCEAQGWPLEVYETPVSYDKLVQQYGFPGPGAHGMFMNYLKGRAIRVFKHAHPDACLASGVRKDESARRFRQTREWSIFEGVPVWAPIWDWTTEDTWRYFNAHGFQRSPAYAILCISGDCLCGAFASPGEREMIASAYPEVHARLQRLEVICGASWGGRAATSRAKRQTSIVCTDCAK